ncbi:MAG: S8 family serine peptidase [Brachymonas sp.]|nr:S8 family serine peptidase [Brachymonas sp.]
MAHGLIIQLKPSAQEGGSRELPSVQKAQRENLAQERMQTIKQGAGIANFAHREISGNHRLMRFAAPLQGTALEDTMRRLRLHPDVASVEPNVRVQLAQTPNDTRFADQWHLGSSTLSPSALNMTQTWAITTGTAVVVAVVDTGILPHPDLAGKVLPGYDFIEDVDNANDGSGRDNIPADPGDWVTASEASLGGAFAGCDAADSSWHGTFIAGQIAAATNNGSAVSGLNWQANILPVRVSGKCGALLTDILDGMRWAAGLSVPGVPANANPARIINLSFGGDQACSASYQTVIDELATVGALVIVAAGNRQSSTDSMQLRRPADCRGVMAVGAVQANGLKTNYSYVGNNMALMAPGGHSMSPTIQATPPHCFYPPAMRVCNRQQRMWRVLKQALVFLLLWPQA